MPSHWGMDDWPQYVQSMDLDYMMPIRAPRHGFEIFRQEFETAKLYGALWIPVIHPFATGRLSRWHVFAEFLAAEMKAGDVWFAPLEEIAAYVKELVDKGLYLPRVERLPQYTEPIGRALPRAGAR